MQHLAQEIVSDQLSSHGHATLAKDMDIACSLTATLMKHHNPGAAAPVPVVLPVYQPGIDPNAVDLGEGQAGQDLVLPVDVEGGTQLVVHDHEGPAVTFYAPENLAAGMTVGYILQVII